MWNWNDVTSYKWRYMKSRNNVVELDLVMRPRKLSLRKGQLGSKAYKSVNYAKKREKRKSQWREILAELLQWDGKITGRQVPTWPHFWCPWSSWDLKLLPCTSMRAPILQTRAHNPTSTLRGTSANAFLKRDWPRKSMPPDQHDGRAEAGVVMGRRDSAWACCPIQNLTVD